MFVIDILFFCLFRHPIPEYYSITVEIARDRITTAEQVVCDSNNPRRTKCPKGYNDGDVYLRRSIDEACHKMVSTNLKLLPTWTRLSFILLYGRLNEPSLGCYAHVKHTSSLSWAAEIWNIFTELSSWNMKHLHWAEQLKY